MKRRAWRSKVGIAFAIGVAGAVLYASPALANCNPVASGGDPLRDCNSNYSSFPAGLPDHNHPGKTLPWPGSMPIGPNPSCEYANNADHPQHSSYSAISGWESLSSVYGGDYPGLDSAEMWINAPYNAWVPSGGPPNTGWPYDPGVSTWVMLAEHDYTCSVGYPWIQIGELTEPGLGSGNEPFPFIFWNRCSGNGGSPYLYFPKTHLQNQSVRFDITWNGVLSNGNSSFTLSIDTVPFANYDDSAAYDTPQYMSEVHLPTEQSPGDGSHLLHVYNLRYGSFYTNTWGVPTVGEWFAGNAAVPQGLDSEATEWQRVNGIDASQYYTQDEACSS